MNKWKAVLACMTVCATVAVGTNVPAGSGRANAGASKADFSEAPVLVSTDVKRSGSESMRVALDSAHTVTGNCAAVKVYVKNASLPAVLMSVSLTDSAGKTYKSNTFDAGKASAVDYAAAGDEYKKLNRVKDSEFIEVPYGFYGTVYLPYASFNRNAGETPADIQSVEVGFGAQSLGYDTLEADIQKVYVFGVYDAAFDEEKRAESARSTIVDYSEKAIADISVDGDTLVLAKADEYDMDSLEYAYNHKKDACKQIGDVKIVNDFDIPAALTALNAEKAQADRLWRYSKMGQTSEYSFVESGISGEMLKYTLPTEQNPDVSNVYSSLHFNLADDAQDWSGAKGITCWVKNPAATEYSVNFEIFLYNDKTDILEQYNLNSSSSAYKTVYAYNTATGEEFSYNTQTFIRVPASFEGWLRIPFSQYEAPAWTMNKPYNSEGVFDIDRYKVYKISFSRLLKSNYGSTLYMDNLGAYYDDFSVGGLFDKTKPSIKECMNGGK